MIPSPRSHALAVVAVIAALAPVAFLSMLPGCGKNDPPVLTDPTPKEPKVYSAAPSTTGPAAPSVATDEPSDLYPLGEDAIRKIVNPSGATEWTGPTGVIEGTIHVVGDKPAMRTFAGLPKGCEHAQDVHGPAYLMGPKGELEGALVAAIGVAGYVRTPRNDRPITIKDCAVEPTVVDMTLGQRLMVTNLDEAPYMPQVPRKMVVKRLALKGMSPVPVMLTEVAPYAFSWIVGADPSPSSPTATVFVLPSALHDVTKLDGKFRIAGVPEGKARLVVTHLGMDEASKDVVVKGGEVLHVDVTLTYKDKTPKPSASSSSSIKKPVIQ
jgi:hypothetical protein